LHVSFHNSARLEGSRAMRWRAPNLILQNPMNPEGLHTTRQKVEDSTMTRWRMESPTPFDESTPLEPAAPLWKDLMVASAVALGLWVAAAVVFG
jgi:hypothetical protein